MIVYHQLNGSTRYVSSIAVTVREDNRRIVRPKSWSHDRTDAADMAQADAFSLVQLLTGRATRHPPKAEPGSYGMVGRLEPTS